jgi:hypothetical protein
MTPRSVPDACGFTAAGCVHSLPTSGTNSDSAAHDDDNDYDDDDRRHHHNNNNSNNNRVTS